MTIARWFPLLQLESAEPAREASEVLQTLGVVSMSGPRLVSDAGSDPLELFPFANREVLERAVAKVVLLGEQVGVGTEQMICLLDSGLTVRELLEYLAARAGNSTYG
jgi:hypothetical protein